MQLKIESLIEMPEENERDVFVIWNVYYNKDELVKSLSKYLNESDLEPKLSEWITKLFKLKDPIFGKYLKYSQVTLTKLCELDPESYWDDQFSKICLHFTLNQELLN